MQQLLSRCRKEKLWPHIREFADRGVAHTKHTMAKLGEAGTPCELYAVHGHYADAGEVAALMSSTLGVDMVMTGHSLGRNKLEHLLGALHLLIYTSTCHVFCTADRPPGPHVTSGTATEAHH